MLVLTAVVDGRLCRWPLENELIVGRGAGCSALIRARGVSRQHVRVTATAGGVEVEDLGSKNGTIVAGSAIHGPHAVTVGQPFLVGEAVLRVDESPTDDLEPALTVVSRPHPSVTGSEAAITAPRLEVDGALSTELLLDHLRMCNDRHWHGPSAVTRMLTDHVEHSLLPWALVVERDGETWLHSGAAGPVPGEVASCTDPTADLNTLVVRTADDHLTLISAADTDPLRAAVVLEIARSLLGGGPAPASAEQGHGRQPMPGPQVVAPTGSRFLRTLDEIARFADADLPVLILGESGTGKEIAARHLHHCSERSLRPFVALNCAALPRDLLDVELFGIEDRVATGVGARPGRFEQASGGTLFLDEIGDMSLDTQARILRVLQEGQLYRVGGRDLRVVDCRVIGATHRDLAVEIEHGRFREDLYYRLAALAVAIPPLRERQGEIPDLVHHHLQHLMAQHRKQIRGVSVRAMRALQDHHWPGNVRELFGEVTRAYHLTERGELIDTTKLSPQIVAPSESIERRIAEVSTLDEAITRLERRFLERAIHGADGNLTRAAKSIGMPRATFYRKARRHGLIDD